VYIFYSIDLNMISHLPMYVNNVQVNNVLNIECENVVVVVEIILAS